MTDRRTHFGDTIRPGRTIPTPDGGELPVEPRYYPPWRDPVLPTGPTPTTPGGYSTVQSGTGLHSNTLVGPAHRIPILFGRCLISPDLAKAKGETASGVTRGRYHIVISEGPIDAIESWYGATVSDFQTIVTTLGSLSPVSGMPSWSLGLAAANILTKATGLWFPQCIARGRLLFDPRLGAWGAGEYPNPAYCAYGTNPALEMADLKAFPQYGAGISPTLIDWTSVGAAADWCDALVSGAKRYEVNIYLQAGKSAKEWEETIGLHAGLRWREEGGLLYLDYSAPVASPAAAITNDDIVEGSRPRMSYGGGAGLADRPNRFRAEWIDPASNWSVRTVEVRLPEVDAGAAIRDGSVYKLHGFQTEAMALRALWRIASEINSEQYLQCELLASRLDIVEGSRVPVTLASMGLSAAEFLVTETSYDGDRISVTMRRYDADTWSPPGSTSGTLPGDSFFDTPPMLPTFGIRSLAEAVYVTPSHRVDTSFLGAWWQVPTFEFMKQIRLKWAEPGGTIPSRKVVRVDVFNGGSGHAVNEAITISGGAGAGATARVSQVAAGVIIAIEVTAAGSGWGLVDPTASHSGAPDGSLLVPILAPVDWNDAAFVGEKNCLVVGTPDMGNEVDSYYGFSLKPVGWKTQTYDYNGLGELTASTETAPSVYVAGCVESLAGLLGPAVDFTEAAISGSATFSPDPPITAAAPLTANALPKLSTSTGLVNSKLADDGTTPTYNGNTLWHAANDGSGSGLDADKLDGIEAAAFAPLASPALTGTPTAPTAASGTNTTQVATTAFVQDAVAGAKVMKAQEYTTGSATFTTPAGVTEVWVTGCGGGGGAGGIETDTAHGGAGGGGGAHSVYRKKLTVTASTGYTVAIGAGGAAGTDSATAGSVTNGAAGGNTTFGALLTLAGGGGGGKATGTGFGAGGNRGGEGGANGASGWPPITGADSGNAVHGLGGVSFPGGYGGGGARGGSSAAGQEGYLLIEWNE